jgi:hypothetical protein
MITNKQARFLPAVNTLSRVLPLSQRGKTTANKKQEAEK